VLELAVLVLLHCHNFP